MQETRGDAIIDYSYDANGSISAFRYKANSSDAGTYYYYARNWMGDIVGIYNSTGTLIARYNYDVWGKLTSVTDADGTIITDESHIAHINPFRYRSYYYDNETGLYYLNSRYYDPVVGRFVNADTTDILSVQSDLYDKNLFAYCDNNPVVRVDVSGYAWETVFDVISLTASVAEVVANPVDPWAWAGLLGDVVDVAIPFVGGLGETVDAVKTVCRVVDKGDDIIDSAKNMRRMASATDDIKTSTGVYVVLYKQGQRYIGKGGFNRAIVSAGQHMTTTNKVSAILWAPTSSSKSAFVSEYLLQSTFGLNKTQKNSLNLIWSPGKTYLKQLQ